MSWPASCCCTAVIDRRGPPVGAVFPQISPCSTPTCRRRPNSLHQVGHMTSARTTSMPTCPPAVVSHRLLVACSVASMLPAALLLPVAAPAGMPTPGTQRQSLAQPALLAELARLKVRCLGLCVVLPAYPGRRGALAPLVASCGQTDAPSLSNSPPRCQRTDKTPLACPSRGSHYRCTSAPHERTLALPLDRDITSLPLSLHRPTLLPRNA
jgi:hypothetical protein